MIGVYGDSFGDINPKHLIDPSSDRLPWPMFLSNMLNDKIESHAQSGTSMWWSYTQFLKTYKKYDTIVFCYSNINRWHNINYLTTFGEVISDRQPRISHIFAEDQMTMVPDEVTHIAKVLIGAHPYLHDEELNVFVCQSIFNNVNKLCKESGIKLVNLMSFEQFRENTVGLVTSQAEGSCLTNLLGVSNSEFVMRIRHFEFLRDYRLKELEKKPDLRFCHLSPYNNKILATIIKESLEQKIEINLLEDPRFSYDINHLKYLL